MQYKIVSIAMATAGLSVLTLSSAYAAVNSSRIAMQPLNNLNGITSSIVATKRTSASVLATSEQTTAFIELYKSMKNHGTRGPALKAKANSTQNSSSFKSTTKTATNRQRVVGKQVAGKKIRLLPGAFTTPAYLSGINGSALMHSAQTKGLNATSEKQFLQRFRQVLKIDNPDTELLHTGSSIGQLGLTHHRYSQSYQGIPVWGAGLVLHSNQQGDVLSMDGKFIPTPSGISTNPRINKSKAMGIVRSDLGLTTYSATSTEIESTGELVIYADENNPNPVLAWKVKTGTSLIKQTYTLVDANSGESILSYGATQTENVLGQGQDRTGINRLLNVWQSGGTYTMQDTSKQMFVNTPDPRDLQQSRGVIHIVNALNQPPTNQPQSLPNLFLVESNSPNGPWDQEAVGAAYNFSETYDYYLTKHNRNSLDGVGGNILAVIRLGQGFANAAWVSEANLMIFGDAEKFTSALDVVAHELTHGVTSKTSNLVYAGQSGALNEAMSDIFGEAIENDSTGDNDWLLGTNLDNPIRNMQNPGAFGDPSRMSQFRVLPNTEAGDFGGVHINSGIINHAFYQLSEGLPNAIGIEAAAQIFYRANTVHLLPRSDFFDARRAAIQSADELFGGGSIQSKAVADAFTLVEIGDTPAPPPTTPGDASNAPDSVVMIFVLNGQVFVGRREALLSDPAQGSFLTQTVARAQRPAVSGNGQFVAFIKDNFDLCFIDTDGSDEACTNFPGLYHSVALSPDGRLAALVLRDQSGNVRPAIQVIDIDNGVDFEFPLKAAVIDGGGVQLNTIDFADAMDFSSDSRFLIYDALNTLSLNTGSEVQTWSIYALDLDNNKDNVLDNNGATFALIAPQLEINIGNPNLSNINPNLITFDAVDNTTGVNTVFTGNLETGELVELIDTSTFAIPSFNGDDTSVIYSVADGTDTGFSLFKQALQNNHLNPSGSPVKWLDSGFAGVIYRRAAAQCGFSPSQASTGTRITATCSGIEAGGSISVAGMTCGGVSATGIVSCTGNAEDLGSNPQVTTHYPSGRSTTAAAAGGFTFDNGGGNGGNNGGGGGGSISWLLLLLATITAAIRRRTLRSVSGWTRQCS